MGLVDKPDGSRGLSGDGRPDLRFTANVGRSLEVEQRVNLTSGRGSPLSAATESTPTDGSNAAIQRLHDRGLNMLAVFDLDSLPEDLAALGRSSTGADRAYTQLILLGSGGASLWKPLQESSFSADPEPIDAYSVDAVEQFLAAVNPVGTHTILYPGNDCSIPLQRLGQLAGWHHESPLLVGINAEWGTWFAYRVAVLADTALPPTTPVHEASPCDSCVAQPCRSACPTGAISADGFDLSACVAFRQEPESPCAHRCLARNACPVAPKARYSEEQISYHYGRSLETIKRYAKK